MFNFKNHVNQELSIKDEIEQRLSHYIEVLQTEVKVAKQILKNPKLRESTFRELNFEKVYYYEHQPQTKEEGRMDPPFDKDKIKIISVPKIKDQHQIVLLSNPQTNLGNTLLSGSLFSNG